MQAATSRQITIKPVKNKSIRIPPSQAEEKDTLTHRNTYRIIVDFSLKQWRPEVPQKIKNVTTTQSRILLLGILIHKN